MNIIVVFNAKISKKEKKREFHLSNIGRNYTLDEIFVFKSILMNWNTNKRERNHIIIIENKTHKNMIFNLYRILVVIWNFSFHFWHQTEHYLKNSLIFSFKPIILILFKKKFVYFIFIYCFKGNIFLFF